MNNKITIGGYYGPCHSREITDKFGRKHITTDFVNDQVYKAISEAGFDVITSYNEMSYNNNPDLVIKNLELCQKYGIKMCLNDERINGDMSDEELAECMAPYSKYESFYGLSVRDEPSTDTYACHGKESSRLYNFSGKMRLLARNNIFGYMNLLLYSHGIGTKKEYCDMVEEYLETCNPPMLSFDHYLLCHEVDSTHIFCERYFYNLRIMKEYADRAGIPLWTFIGAGCRWNDNGGIVEKLPLSPTSDQTMWLVNSNLIWGAKGIQWFPLVQPHWFAYAPNDELDCDRNGVFGADGKPNAYYEIVKRANTWIREIEAVLAPAKHLAVIAKGTFAQDYNGVYTDSYGPVTSIDIDNRQLGAMVGVFDYNGKHAFMVLNYNDLSAAQITINFDKEYDLTVYTEGNKATEKSSAKTLDLGAGAAAVIVLN